ncbi:hypothetical protein OE88DRAFT_1807711 [Heliocybe sulcata]|uniref:Secreted protein n=1 Tax=Heliocybe sulcata TaxID=5364 RepID=A0A5C3N3B9_9AGAM|nr:hypothetical protein OE88DRAFT_1807711 [Heliocybe sulcata]
MTLRHGRATRRTLLQALVILSPVNCCFSGPYLDSRTLPSWASILARTNKASLYRYSTLSVRLYPVHTRAMHIALLRYLSVRLLLRSRLRVAAKHQVYSILRDCTQVPPP